MMIKKLPLTEAFDRRVFIDSFTGKAYVIKGKKFVEFEMPEDSDGGKGGKGGKGGQGGTGGDMRPSKSNKNNNSSSSGSTSSQDNQKDSEQNQQSDTSSSGDSDAASASSVDNKNKENNKSASNKDRNKKELRIGDRGDEEFNKREEEARKAQALKDAEERKKAAKANGKEADTSDLVKDIEPNTKWDTEEGEESVVTFERKARRKEAEEKAAKERANYASNPLVKLTLDMKSYFQRFFEDDYESTPTRFNKKLINYGVYAQGKKISEKTRPMLAVFLDSSGSFTSEPEKWEKCLGTLEAVKQFEKDGLLDVEVFYHDDKVLPGVGKNHAVPAGAGGGNDAQKVARYIADLKPDNILIATDNNIDTSSVTHYTCPGACWYLFFESQSPNFMKAINGAKKTKSFYIP